MSHRISALLGVAVAAVGVTLLAACVDVPDRMRAEFAPPGPSDRTNFKPGLHGTAAPNVTHFKVSGGYDAGAETVAPPPTAAPAAPADAGADPMTAQDGGIS